nr:hypothetical protein CcurKRNrm1_p011 [Cryptomonas curvata]
MYYEYMNTQSDFLANFVKNFQFNSTKIFLYYLNIKLNEKKQTSLLFFISVIVLSIESNKILKKINMFLQFLNNSAFLAIQIKKKIQNKITKNFIFVINTNFLLWRKQTNLCILNYKTLTPISIFYNGNFKFLNKKIITSQKRLSYKNLIIIAEVIDKKKSIKDIFYLIKYKNKTHLEKHALLVIQQRKILNFLFYFLCHKRKILFKYLKNKKKKKIYQNYDTVNLYSIKFNLISKKLKKYFLIDFFNKKFNSNFTCASKRFFLIKKKKNFFMVTWLKYSLKTKLSKYLSSNLKLHFQNIKFFKKNSSLIFNKKFTFDNVMGFSYNLYFRYISLTKFFFDFIKKNKKLFSFNYLNFFFINNIFIQRFSVSNENINVSDLITILIYYLDIKRTNYKNNYELLEFYNSKRFYLNLFQFYSSMCEVKILTYKNLIYPIQSFYYIWLFFRIINIETIISVFTSCLIYLDNFLNLKFSNCLYEIFHIIETILNFFFNFFFVSKKVIILLSKMFQTLKKKGHFFFYN